MFSAKKLLRHFLSGTKTPLTVHAYAADLEDLRIFMKASSVEAAITRLLGGTHSHGQELIAGYLADMRGRRELGPATVNRRLSTLRSLGKESRILGMVPWVLEARNVKAEHVRDTRGPGIEDILRLLRHMEGLPRTKPALRDRAMIQLLIESLRRGTICALDVPDCLTRSKEIRVREKGNRMKHTRKISGDTARALDEWLAVRGPAPGPVFINFDTIHRTKTGKRLSGSALAEILAARGRQAGCKHRLHPHGIRHTILSIGAEEAARKKYGMEKLRLFSGHASVQSLQRYLDEDRSVQGELVDAVAERLRPRSDM